jgi:hypothetical protein
MGRNTVSLTGIRLKRERTWELLKHLAADIDAFLDSRPYKAAVNFKALGLRVHRLTVEVQVDNLPDPMWGVRIGEIVHNCRSALDHIVWELAGHPSPSTARTQFPICETEADFGKPGTKQFLEGVRTTAAIQLIKEEQPFSLRQGTAEGVAQAQESGVDDGIRTRDLQGHNLAL